MYWVEEDYELLYKLFDAGRLASGKATALPPGRQLRLIRRGLKLSQLQAAQRAGVDRSLISRVEAGGDARLRTIQRLFSALGCGLLILPASEKLLKKFRAEAHHRRRADREWEKIRRENGLDKLTDSELVKSLKKDP